MLHSGLVREISTKSKENIRSYETYSPFGVDIRHVRMCISMKYLYHVLQDIFDIGLSFVRSFW